VRTSDYERRCRPATGEVLGPAGWRVVAVRRGRADERILQKSTLAGVYRTVYPNRRHRADRGGWPLLLRSHGRADMLKEFGRERSRLEVEAALRKAARRRHCDRRRASRCGRGQIVVAAGRGARGSAPTKASLQAAMRERRRRQSKSAPAILVISPEKECYGPLETR